MEEEVYRVTRGKPPLHSRFKPGISGNPSGRPKGPSLGKEILRQAALPLSEVLIPDKPTDAVVVGIARNLLRLAMDGNKDAVGAIRTVLERMDGAVPQALALAYEETDPRRFILDLTGRGVVEHVGINGNGHEDDVNGSGE